MSYSQNYNMVVSSYNFNDYLILIKKVFLCNEEYILLLKNIHQCSKHKGTHLNLLINYTYLNVNVPSCHINVGCSTYIFYNFSFMIYNIKIYV